jgi:hypothetical protein
LLFIDADVRLAPDGARALIARTQAQGAEMASALGRLVVASFWERVVQTRIGAVIAGGNPLHEVNDPDHERALANGQCLLFRREAYDRLGGHEAIRGSVLDDVDFALALLDEVPTGRNWTGLQARAATASFEGLDGEVAVSGHDLDVEINLAASDSTTVDFLAAKNAGAGFGSERTRVLDMAGRPGDTVRASGEVSLTAFDFLHAQARLVFEQAQKTVKLNNGNSVAVDVLTIGATDVTAFVGINPGTNDAVGFGIEDADFMMLTLVESAPAAGQTARQWSTIAGSAASAGFQGAEALEISGNSIKAARLVRKFEQRRGVAACNSGNDRAGLCHDGHLSFV